VLSAYPRVGQDRVVISSRYSQQFPAGVVIETLVARIRVQAVVGTSRNGSSCTQTAQAMRASLFASAMVALL